MDQIEKNKHKIEQAIQVLGLPLDRSLNIYELPDGEIIYVKYARNDTLGNPIIILWENGMDLERPGVQFTCEDGVTPLRLTNAMEPGLPYVEFGTAEKGAGDSIELKLYSNPLKGKTVPTAA